MDSLYKQVVSIYRGDLKLTPEQKANLEAARVAYQVARAQQDTASKARKDKVARMAEADVALDDARKALTEAQKPETEAERQRYMAALAVAEQLYASIARLAFGTISDSPIRYVNVVPTGETTTDYYGTHSVARTTVDDEPVPLRVRAYEVANAPFRIVIQANQLDELSFKVVVLKDTDAEGAPGVREDRFGSGVEISHDTGHFRKDPSVEIRWSSASRATIEEAEVYIDALNLGLEVARLVTEIVGL